MNHFEHAIHSAKQRFDNDAYAVNMKQKKLKQSTSDSQY